MKLQYLQAGQIVSTHGIRGEVKVLPWADGPEFLTQFSRIRIGGRDYQVDSCRIQKTCNLLKIQGVDTVEAAQALREQIVEIYREDAPQDLIFAAELEGMTVLAEGQEIGKIQEVLDYPGNEVYVVKGEHEYMIPAVEQFILSTDLRNNVMQVQLIRGMRTDEN